MKTIVKITVFGFCLCILYTVNVPPKFPIRLEFVPKAHAILGVRRRAFRRGAVVGASASASATATTTAAATAPPAQQTAPAPAPAPVPAPAGVPPLGSMVSTLPNGCAATPINDVEYYKCSSGVYYRTAFQGSNLVYVVSQP